MKPVLPITAIVPSFNCVGRINSHLDAMMNWLEHVAEVIVVDSYSKDGSYERLQQALSPYPHVRWIQCPPGLYQSWNRGIHAATQPYLYFSTIGDTITLEGLERLYHYIHNEQLDVIVSPPRLVADNTVKDAKPWPIHEIIQAYQLNQFTRMPPKLVACLSLYYLQSSLLGSSASNLYKTQTLQKSPFPTDHSRTGDSAWLIKQAPHIQFGLLPDCYSTFLIHEQENNSTKNRGKIARLQCAQLAYETYIALTGIPPADCKEIAQNLCQFEDQPRSGSLLKNYSKQAKASANTAQKLLLLCLIDSMNLVYHKQRFNQYKRRIGPLRYCYPKALYHRHIRKRIKAQLVTRLLNKTVLDTIS
ncbi:glycosyltransferase family A protein [Coraliomargarita sp. SDUM461004]|uniref:Glycosyltransferase family A protein n=1 Tax=Thalassobacterium sedimentorum TaxID=3041258 RepID=A0ABU1AKG7_9BACT|nr:glycosyltransferase family A protein [Coraliomargarita sp. SDUM461004]MDQ8195154.1 glycosyltransferase family A protein [Coraliomargarita sp. SDUM461004]